MLPLEMLPLLLQGSTSSGVNKLLYSPPTKSISYVERQDSVVDCDCDCDYDVDGYDYDKKIPGTSCGDLYLLIDFGWSGNHPPADCQKYKENEN